MTKLSTSLDPHSAMAAIKNRGYVEITPGVFERPANGANAPAPTPVIFTPAGKARPKDFKILERRFCEMYSRCGGDLDDLTPEYRFHPVRKWRADFFHETSKSLIEVEGGLYGFGGKHNKADGYQKDAEKYNMASALGFRVFRLTSKMITPEYVTQLIGWINDPVLKKQGLRSKKHTT